METIVTLGLLDTPQKSTASFSPTGPDKNGNLVPAKVSSPAWAVDNSDVATITPSSDGSTCDIQAGNDGVALVTLTGTTAKGNTLTAQIQVTVTAGEVEATLLNISTSAPVDVAAPAPAADAAKA